MKNPIVKIKNKVKNAFLNMGESEYGANARAVTGDTTPIKQVRQDEWDTMANTIKKRIRQAKQIL